MFDLLASLDQMILVLFEKRVAFTFFKVFENPLKNIFFAFATHLRKK